MSTIALSLGTRRPLRRLRMPFLLAFAAAALAAGLGRAVTTTYLPLLLERIADAPGLIGMVMLVNAGAGMAVPLVTGMWSDRLQRSGRGRRMPFVIGGSLVTAGGLLAIAFGFATSYLVLALFAAVVYTGLNALTTAHRALIPETFDETGRAKATSAQELAMLGGGLVGLAAGGLLFGIAPWAPFALAAVLVPLLAAPTISRVREPAVDEHGAADEGRGKPRAYGYTYYLHAVRRPGVGAFLLAQILWVLGYAALPAFFLLYAEDVLALEPGVASLMLAGFGLATGAAILGAGRIGNPALHRPLLLLGVVLLGGGFLGVAASTSLPLVGAALVVGAAGFGLVSTLGFPIFSTLIPPGEAGGYTALYFSVRAISSTIALPAAGWTVAATGSYRALFVLGGVATLTALVPLAGVPRVRGRGRTAVALLASVPVLGLLIAQTGASRLDEAVFGAINGLGPGPEILWTVLDPHTRNYLLLIGLAVAAGALTTPRLVPGIFVRVLGSALLAWGLLEAVYAVYDRPRPEEVLSGVSLNDHSWAHLNSFPSGHMAITAALAIATAILFPRLRTVLLAYVGAVAFTRVMFGAHFPLDVVAGTALGTASALLVAVSADRVRGRTHAAAAVDPLPDDATVVAVMPSYNDVPPAALVESTLAYVDRLVLVDDGSDDDVAAELDALADDDRVELVRLPARGGKGSAVRAGVERVRGEVDAVVVIDADAQHPPEAIPAFVHAAHAAELVIGDRFGDLREMPPHRRVANRTTRRLFQLRTGLAVRDTQNGMRLIRGRALDLLPGGGFEAETTHLRHTLDAEVAVAWVPIPALYGEGRSSFRTGRDSLRVLWALVQPNG
jgi:membrane-associated phospholipid phosphatase/predicted MFS family arabinose efflux permease